MQVPKQSITRREILFFQFHPLVSHFFFSFFLVLIDHPNAPITPNAEFEYLLQAVDQLDMEQWINAINEEARAAGPFFFLSKLF